MFEKVNMAHCDKIADRIAGFIVDLAYKECENPKVAVEVLIGHDMCKIITESNIQFSEDKYADEICKAVDRIVGYDGFKKKCRVEIMSVKQDPHLAENQSKEIRCGDNGIFKGVPVSLEEEQLTDIARIIYSQYPYDGKYILDLKQSKLIICQSNCDDEEVRKLIKQYATYRDVIVNPLGFWVGGINSDTGAVSRKLGSDMGRAVTGGGLHGKCLSKADVSVNILCHLLAQEDQCEVSTFCAIGDKSIVFDFENGKKLEMSYKEVTDKAKQYIDSLGGFEKFAEWGLIR